LSLACCTFPLMGARIRVWAERWDKQLVLGYRVALAVGGYWFMYAQGGRIDGDWWNPLTWLNLVFVVAVGALAIHTMAVFALFVALIPIGIIDTTVFRRRLQKAKVATSSKKTPPRPVEVPDEYWSPEPIVAWRRWQPFGVTLRGARQPWPSPTFEATCHTCGTVPGWNCTCGIYATKAEQRWGTGYGAIYGRVELTGNVVEHDQGYRAERARIIELFVPADLRPEEIASRYPDVTIHIVAPLRKAIG
jgi:hypothetical protein